MSFKNKPIFKDQTRHRDNDRREPNESCQEAREYSWIAKTIEARRNTEQTEYFSLEQAAERMGIDWKEIAE